MKLIFNVKQRVYGTPKFTFGKEYDIVADYTKRMSGQKVRDNGYVIKNDLGEIDMVFKNQVIISDDKQGDTYIFSYK
jgi:hypothetical protein